MQRPCHFLLCAGALCVTAPAIAQTTPKPGQFNVALSGFQNIVGAVPVDQPDTGPGILSESEIEVSPLYKTVGGTLLGVRGVFNVNGHASKAQSRWQAAVPEISAFTTGTFGRIEIGVRAGFPQSLLGFTPSEIAFTAAPFGPDSGARLDPNGRLPTQFLPPALAGRINGLSYLGYAARLYDDRSPKIIYLSPRSHAGFYGAFSYTPRTVRPAGFSLADGGRGAPGNIDSPLASGRFRDVVQSALVWNHRTANLDLSAGLTYTHATADQGLALTRLRNVDSLSSGLLATVRDSWTFGISATYDGLSNRAADPVTGRRPTRPFGVVASADYVQGPWVFGGYYQHAHADSLTATPHRDTLDIGEVGLSYLVDRNHDLLGMGRYTDVKLFTAAYIYSLQSDEAAASGSNQRGAVLITGARFAFF